METFVHRPENHVLTDGKGNRNVFGFLIGYQIKRALEMLVLDNGTKVISIPALPD
jgi:uncharacterized membrane protein (Fun14 family)